MSTYTSKTTLDSAMQPDNPIKASVHRQVVENIEAVAERGTNAPIVQVPVQEFLTTTQTWTIPDGVSAFRAILIGGGGGVSTEAAGDGGDTIVVYDGVTVTAGGGLKSNQANTGGVATGGDINIKGGSGYFEEGADTIYGSGGVQQTSDATGYGSSGGDTGSRSGGAGARAEKRFVVASGVTTVSVTIGAAGYGGATYSSYSGRPGLVVMEY